MTTAERPQRAEWDLEPETRLLRQLQTAITEVELAMSRRMGLGHTDLSAMSHLAFAQERLGPSELSERLGVSPAATTQLIDRLEGAGHVRRERDAVDRRRVRLFMTASAGEEVRQLLWPLVTAMDEVALRLSDEQRQVVTSYLTDVIALHRSFSEDGAPSPMAAPSRGARP